MIITADNKQKAFLGFRKGLGAASAFVGLRRIELKNDHALEFESYHRFNPVSHFTTITRVYTNHQWAEPSKDPYQAGVDAGTGAKAFFKKVAPAPPFEEQRHNIDPDLKKWSQDLTEQA
jgi:hypothetical protein